MSKKSKKTKKVDQPKKAESKTSLPKDHKFYVPSVGKRLTKEEIEKLS